MSANHDMLTKVRGPQSPAAATWHVAHIDVLCAVFLGSALRLACLSCKSMWLDEVLSISVARLGPGPLLAGTSEVYHPPLYFLILSGWLRLGDSVAQVRLLSALAGILVIPTLYLVSKVLLGRRAATSAAWFAALAPLPIWYAQEARDYSLLLLLSVLALLGLANLVTKPRLHWWGLFVVGTTAAFYTHYSAFLALVVQVIVATILLSRKRGSSISLLYVAAGWIAVVLLYLPWLNTPGAQRFRTLLTASSFYINVLTAGRARLPDGLEFLLEQDLPRVAGLIALCGLVVALAGLSALYRMIRSRPIWLLKLRYHPVVKYLVSGCFVLLTTLSVIPRGYTVKRYTLVLWPIAFIGLAWVWPWHRGNKRALSALLSLSLLASLANVFVVPKAQWDQVVQLVLAEQEPGDGVLLSPPYVGLCFDYYAKGQMPYTGVGQDGAESALTRLFEAHPRLWFVSDTMDVDPHRVAILEWLDEHAQQRSATDFYRVRVELYQLK